MEIILYSAVGLIAILAIFIVIEQPYKFAAVIVFMMFYQFNFDTPLPLDARGLLLLLLFIRLYFFDKENINYVNIYLLINKLFWLILLFTFLILIEPIVDSKHLVKNIKPIILPIITLILGFILVKNKDGRKSIFYGILLAGIFSSIDLLVNFFTRGTLDAVKLPELLLGKVVILNHNTPGILAGLGVVYVYLAWYRTKLNRFLLIIVGFLLLLGLFISTSRSALLAIMVTIVIMTLIESDLRHNIKRIFQMGAATVVLLVGFFFVYNAFLTKTNSNENTFLDTVYYRLFEEPLQMFGEEKAAFNKWTGNRIKGSMKFRSARWQHDFGKFTSLGLSDQVFGLGPKGYLSIAQKIYAKNDNIYQRLAPHNGYLIILLERGILGLVLFFILIVAILISAFRASKNNRISLPFIYLLVILLIYTLAQNAEITSAYSYLTFGAIIGDIVRSQNQRDEENSVL